MYQIGSISRSDSIQQSHAHRNVWVIMIQSEETPNKKSTSVAKSKPTVSHLDSWGVFEKLRITFWFLPGAFEYILLTLVTYIDGVGGGTFWAIY